MAPEGLFMLNAISEILEMVDVQSVEPDVFFSIDDVDELRQAINHKKCPVINVIKRECNQPEEKSISHAMIATGLTSDEKFLQCKNSYRNDPTKIDGGDVQIVYIALDPSDISSEWTLFNGTKTDDGKPCVDAYFISIDLSA